TPGTFRELFGESCQERGLVGRVLLRTYPVVRWLENTLLVFGASIALTLGLSVMAGYGLGWLRPPGWRGWRRGLLATYAIPHTILFLPLYQVVIRLGLEDSLAALLLTYPMLALPFSVCLLSAYWEPVPPAPADAARA